jgi:hypothetical protein
MEEWTQALSEQLQHLRREELQHLMELSWSSL